MQVVSMGRDAERLRSQALAPEWGPSFTVLGADPAQVGRKLTTVKTGTDGGGREQCQTICLPLLSKWQGGVRPQPHHERAWK